MNAVKNIIMKELTRVFTDKKLVISLFIMPGLLIMILYSIMGEMAQNMMTDIEKHVPTVYMQNTPKDFDQAIKATGYQAKLIFLDSKADTTTTKKDIREGEVELLVIFEEGFSDKVQAYRKAGDPIPEVKTYYNSAEDYSAAARENFLDTVLTSYQQTIISERLGNMEQLTVFYVDKDPTTSDIVDDEKASGKMLSMLLPFLINIMLFSSAMGLGVDAITGEKERGTLSSMLITPIKRSAIVIGKLISLGILSSISAIIYAVSVTIGIQRLSGGSMEGLGNINFSPLEMLQLLVMLIIIVYLYVALVALVAVYARTAKEANTYVMPLMIVVMLGSVLTMFSGGSDRGLKYYAIPIYNSSISIQDLLMGELSMPQFGLTIGTTILLAAFITMLITKAFQSEKIMFNA